MASRTTVTLVDDLDGTEAEQTVSFGLEGVDYEIDLSSAHAEALRDAVLQVLSTSEYRHPFYWAGFVMIGNGY